VNRNKAATLDLLLGIKHHARTTIEHAAADLILGAFFFCCRSCEYLQVGGTQRKTKPISVGDVEFWHGKQRLRHDHPNLHLADFVRVTFRLHKNGDKMTPRIQWKTKNPTTNPVVIWSRVIQRTRATTNCNETTEVFNVKRGLGRTTITDAIVINLLRTQADRMGVKVLGYSSKNIGTHSIRSGAAMALVLGGAEVWEIMLLGRWRSFAFMDYIREQVRELRQNTSETMTKHSFFNVPHLDSPALRSTFEAQTPPESTTGIQSEIIPNLTKGFLLQANTASSKQNLPLNHPLTQQQPNMRIQTQRR
jgi:hypothetical protein